MYWAKFITTILVYILLILSNRHVTNADKCTIESYVIRTIYKPRDQALSVFKDKSRR